MIVISDKQHCDMKGGKERKIGKTLVQDLDARNDRGQEEKGKTEDEMVAWHHPINGHNFEQAP